MDVDTLLSQRIRDLRQARGHTLEQLATLSGVSRSMISLIERRQTSPTAAVLDKLADALGVSLATLFSTEGQAAPPQPLARRSEQPVWTDPASGYVRRQLTPQDWPSPMDLAALDFPAGETVAFELAQRSTAVHQQMWMLEGCMDIHVGAQSWRLQAGDCLAMALGERIVFHNPARQPARYLLATTRSPAPLPRT
jgi:transcriptional regulator with XRE-family HTH domain